MSSEEKPQAPPEAPVVASGDLLAEKSAALAEKLAAEVMNYIANQFCMSKDITRSEIAALFETDVRAFLAANPELRGGARQSDVVKQEEETHA